VVVGVDRKAAPLISSPSQNRGEFSRPWRSEMITVRSLATSSGAKRALVIRSASMRRARSIRSAGIVS
jgi:hypothetical protein